MGWDKTLVSSHIVGVTSSHPDNKAQIFNNLRKSTHYSHNQLIVKISNTDYL